jgi:ABC-type spermidine/putrescine transport system permease subunit II
MRIGGKTIAALVFALLAIATASAVGFAAAFVYVESRPPGTELTASLGLVAALLIVTPPLATAIAMVLFVRDVSSKQREDGRESR